MKRLLFITCLLTILACNNNSNSKKIPVIGFADGIEDNTLKQATNGFRQALSDNGFDEKENSIKIIYRNAQGNIPTLSQIIRFFISEKVDLIATNPTVSTIAAVQNTSSIPVFMMVSGTPSLMNVVDASGQEPSNLYGVAENLAYIDTSFGLMKQMLPAGKGRLRVGMIFNQSEPQSVEALNRIKVLAQKLNIELIAQPLNSSADALLVTQSLLNNKIDAFFANPDNTVFSAFETIFNSCNKANVPVFTSEAGLVARGAVAAYGADMYRWGYDAGLQAVRYLKTKDTTGIRWQMVSVRKRVYNPESAKRFNIAIPANFEKL